jgi:hypothetical protein
MTTKKEHLINLRRHDWSYCMSDDGSVYRRGSAAESGLIQAERANPKLVGMYETYHKWWWGLADGSNIIGSGSGRSSGAPEPTFGLSE